jgi:gamma-glutamylcyclotransferase
MTVLWYFAYGSNMQSATLRGRRGIEYRRALPARLDGWRLVLDKPPLIPMGGSFANVIPDPTAAVHGVLFEITEDDLAHLDLTEGVFIGNYERVPVTVWPLSPTGAEAVVAYTLTSERRDPHRLPTQRYMRLLIEGAEEHGLPADYVALLRSMPAREETPEAAEFRPLMDQLMRRPGKIRTED